MLLYEEVIRLSKNPYWNTMWSNRDQEFYWSGVKFGALFSAIMIPVMVIDLYVLIDEFKKAIKE